MKHRQSRFLALFLTAAMTLSSTPGSLMSLKILQVHQRKPKNRNLLLLMKKKIPVPRLKNLLLKNSLQRLSLQILQIHQIFPQP